MRRPVEASARSPAASRSRSCSMRARFWTTSSIEREHAAERGGVLTRERRNEGNQSRSFEERKATIFGTRGT